MDSQTDVPASPSEPTRLYPNLPIVSVEVPYPGPEARQSQAKMTRLMEQMLPEPGKPPFVVITSNDADRRDT